MENRLLGLHDEMMSSVTASQTSSRLSSVAAAVSAAGEALDTVGFGVTRLGEAPPDIDGDLQYRIGSITKTFTSALVLSLAGEGMVRLDDRVGEHIEGTEFG